MKQQPLRSGVIKSKGAGMRMMRFLAVFLCALLCTGLFAGCGGSDEEDVVDNLTTRTVTEDTFSGTVRIGVSTDVPDVTPLLAGLPETYTTEQYDSEKALIEALGEGRVQMAVLTPGGAAVQYASTPSFTLVSPVFLGGYRLVGNKNILTIQAPLRGSGGTAADAVATGSDGTAGDAGTAESGDSGTNTTAEDGGDSEAATDETGDTSATTDQQAASTEQSAAADAVIVHDPVEAGEISSDNVLPSQLRGCRINVWHDTNTLIDLAAALGPMDGTAIPSVIRRYEEETPHDYLTEYNHYALTNVCTAYGGQEAFTNLDTLLDVDAYWEAMTREPLPSAILVISNALLQQTAAEELDVKAILSRDFEAAMSALGEQGEGPGRIVYYGSSNRGNAIMRTYYMQVYGLTNQTNYFPADAFYMK